MQKIWSIARLQLRLILGSKAALVVFIGLPLFMTALFGVIMQNAGGQEGQGQRFPVAVVDKDGSLASQALVAALGQEPLLRVSAAAEADLPKLMADRKIQSAVVIPAGFQAAVLSASSPEVALIAPPGGNPQVAVTPAVQRQAARVGSDLAMARKSAGTDAPDALKQAYAKVVAAREKSGAGVSIEPIQKADTGKRSYAPGAGEQALGFTVMFVMMMVFNATGVVLQERQAGTWGRILTAPTSRVSLLAGYLISFFLAGMMQFGTLILATRLLFGVDWGPLLPLTAIASAFVLCSAGLGLFVAGLVRTAEQQRVVGTILVAATSMLGGVYWPLEFVGPVMRRIGYLTPQAWAMDGFREVLLRGGSWAGLAWPLAVLAGLTVIFLGAGLARIRYE